MPCIHYRFYVKRHVRDFHGEEWAEWERKFCSGLVDEEEDYVPTAEGATNEMQDAGEQGAGHAVHDDADANDVVNHASQGGHTSIEDTEPGQAADEAAMQVSYLFCEMQFRILGVVVSSVQRKHIHLEPNCTWRWHKHHNHAADPISHDALSFCQRSMTHYLWDESI